MWGRKLGCSQIDRPGLVRLRHDEEGLRALTLAACKAMFGDSTVRCAEAKTTTFSPHTAYLPTAHQRATHTPTARTAWMSTSSWCVGAPREAAPRGAALRGVRSYLFNTDVRSILMDFITAFQRCVLQQCERRAPPARSAQQASTTAIACAWPTTLLMVSRAAARAGCYIASVFSWYSNHQSRSYNDRSFKLKSNVSL